MNILFTADVHVNKKRVPDVITFFELCKDIIKERKIDLFVIGGDLWNAMIPNTKGSGFVDIVQQLKDIKELCNVSMIYGTPSHEPEGSLDFATTFGIKVYRYPTVEHYDDGDLLYIPEPRRSDFIASTPTEISKAICDNLTDVCMTNAPDVIFYHGEMDNAYMDNGRACESDYKLSKNMIELSGAKLVLAGHIHTPQLPLENCYYVGSPIPCSFGETHHGSVITFTLKDKTISNLERIKTHAPRYKTVELESEEELPTVKKMKLKNCIVKVSVPLSAGKKLSFNTNSVAKEIQEATEARSVQVKIFTKQEVSVRSKEIAKASTISDKLKIYGEINEINITPEIYEKAKQFEDNLLINYTFPSHSFELISLSLRGAKGIKNKEEIFVDFSKYEDGLVALIGENGCGKTTLLEMASPFPCLLTRSGALKSHFYLKDSHKIVVFKDENGIYYKFSILIAGHIDSGMVKYFAETSKDGETWKPVKECTGNLDDYKDYVESLFGNVSLYLRTAFFTKGKTKGTPDIASASKGERIDLLSQLLGTDNLIALHTMAKDTMKDIKSKLEKFEDVEKSVKEFDDLLKDYTSERNSMAKQLHNVDCQLDKLHKEIPELQKKAIEFNEKFKGQSKPEELKAECKERIEALKDLIARLEKHIEQNEFFLCYEKDINNLKQVLSEYDELSKKVIRKGDKVLEKKNEMNESENVVRNAQQDVDLFNSQITHLNELLARTKASIPEVSDVCPTCGAKLSKAKQQQLFNEQAKLNDEVTGIESNIVSKKEELKEATSKLKVAKEELKKATKAYELHNEEYTTLSFTQASMEQTISDNEKLREYINYVPVSTASLTKDLELNKKNLQYAQDTLISLEAEEYVDINAELKEAQELQEALNSSKIEISMKIASLNTQIEMADARLQGFRQDMEEIAHLSTEYDDYAILEKAFSNSGIQALELESAAPNIADLTNQILKESYGDKFTVSFSTLRQGRSKLVDDFSINVTNNETGWTTPIELLSEGEKIWIIQSLYYAFSLIRMEKTGFSFKVRFVDESDGALDSDMRLKYVNMIESAHKAGNARLTIMITHSQEVKDIVTQVISLS